MKRTYAKPAMTVERFQANVAVAANCQTDFTGETQADFPYQTVICRRGSQANSETVFAKGQTGCQYQPAGIVKFSAGTYTIKEIADAFGGPTYVSYNTNNQNNKVTITDDLAGYWICWGGEHFGPATGDVLDIMTNSY